MATEHIHVDISDAPELLRLAEEVISSGRPRVLSRNSEALVVVTPARPRRPKGKAITGEDIAAALSASWEGWIDPEQLKRELDEARSDNRPPVEL